MARDLIGPALPPGFKKHATAEDEERDLSPGKPQRAPALAGSLASTAEWARPAQSCKLGTKGCLGPDHY